MEENPRRRTRAFPYAANASAAFFGLLLCACTTTAPWTAGTVTTSHLYLHRLPVDGVRESAIAGYRCTIRPLFFRQDPTRLEQRGVLEALEMSGYKNAAAEKVSGTLTTEHRGLWTRQCATFTAVPVVRGSGSTGSGQGTR